MDVEKVVVRVSEQGARTTNNREMPDINMQYMVSVMLLDGTATLEAVHDLKRMSNQKVMAMRSRVELIGDAELQKLLPARHGIVEVTLKGGRTLRHHKKAVRGTPENPMPRPEVDEKCYNLCMPVLGRARAQALRCRLEHRTCEKRAQPMPTDASVKRKDCGYRSACQCALFLFSSHPVVLACKASSCEYDPCIEHSHAFSK
jgi:2-methylcitrate dehydratase PrpD